MNIEITAKRLKQLREEKGLSHAKLKVKLKEDYNTEISEASLKNYEISNKYHSNFGGVKGMKIEFLYAFSELYNVSVDYLLGKTDVRYLELEDREIYNKTGLSPMAINSLKRIKNSNIGIFPNINKTIVFDCMLSNDFFAESLVSHLFNYCKTQIDIDKSCNEADKEKSIFYSINTERCFVTNLFDKYIDYFYNQFKTVFAIEEDPDETI